MLPVCLTASPPARRFAGRPATTLGVDGARFTLNGRPAFLYGVSYYGGLGAREDFVRRDLDDMQRYGFNWVRVWARWSGFSSDVSAVDGPGRPREPYLDKLKAIVAACDRRGMVVDVTIWRGSGANGSERSPEPEAHRRAVETIVMALKPWRNWYLDLSNERNIRDARFVTMEDLARLRDLVRRLDPRLLVTASHGGDIGRDDLRGYLQKARLDFIAPHRPRNAGSPRQTEARTREYFAWMKEMGRVVPVHYQEPFRRGYAEWNPTARDFVTDLHGAIAGGAAGWCLHNGDERGQPGNRPRRSFDLRDQRLFDQLDDQERTAIELMERVVPSVRS